MKVPMKPPAGTCLVLCNAHLDEFDPEVEEICCSYKEALDYVEATIDEEPGNLYMVVRIEELWFHEVKVKRQTRGGTHKWSKPVVMR